MARVLIDASIFGESWFQNAMKSLLEDDKVRFTYTTHKKMLAEHQNARSLGALYKRLGDIGRRDDVSSTAVERHVNHLEGIEEWLTNADCDDPHIFALVYAKPTRFVFTKDSRMGNCRDCLRSTIDKRYCQFILVMSSQTYRRHRTEIHS